MNLYFYKKKLVWIFCVGLFVGFQNDKGLFKSSEASNLLKIVERFEYQNLDFGLSIPIQPFETEKLELDFLDYI